MTISPKHIGLPFYGRERKPMWNRITIERWKDGTTFTRFGGRRVDDWFARYVSGKEKPNYLVPAIPVATVIRRDVVFQRWQYMISSNNAPLNNGRCLAGNYYAMLDDWRTSTRSNPEIDATIFVWCDHD